MTVNSRRTSMRPSGGRLRGDRVTGRGYCLGSQNLIKQKLGLVFVGAFGQRQLAHENLTCLGQHALLTGGQTALAVTSPQVANNLGDLVDVAGRDLLDVGLVAPGPVGRLFGVGSFEDLEDPLQAVLTDDITDADVFSVVRRNPDSQVALGNLQNEVHLFLALDDPGLDRLDQSCPMMGVDDSLADLERHALLPFRHPKGSTQLRAASWLLRTKAQVRALISLAG